MGPAEPGGKQAMLRNGSRRLRLGVLVAAIGAALVLIAALPPVPQPLSYHQFADRRTCLGIPNCLDVASNLALLAAGVAGLIWPGWGGKARIPEPEATAYRLFFLAIALTGIGSAYYHWAPDNARLLWDRLPMSLAFMALLAATVAERLGARAGRLALPALPPIGVASVLAWYLSELVGTGDLRPYLAMQAGGALGVLLLVTLFPPRYSRGGDLLLVLGLYGLALLGDKLLDRPILALGEVVSGHTLKHVLAGLAVLAVLRMLKRRGPLPALP